MNSVWKTCVLPVLAVLILVGGIPCEAGAAGSVGGYAWSESTGWINFSPGGEAVQVGEDHLCGRAWGENIGWIRMSHDDNPGCDGDPVENKDASNWGVKTVGNTLAGYAWSEASGWINFEHPGDVSHPRVVIQGNSLVGYAWGENIGWIRFGVTPEIQVTIYGSTQSSVVASAAEFLPPDPGGETEPVQPHFPQPVATGRYATYAVTLRIDGRSPGNGDEIGIYDSNGVLCGAYRVSDGANAGLLVVYGDDPVTSQDEGPDAHGELLSARYWDASMAVDLPVRLLAVNGDRTAVPLVWQDGGGFSAILEGLHEKRIGTSGQGTWRLDANGSGVFDETFDTLFAGFSPETSTAVTGDWNGDGLTDGGYFAGGVWYLDNSGDGVWDETADQAVAFGSGSAEELPVAGDWNGDGLTDLGIFRQGTWFLDLEGSFSWPVATGTETVFGAGQETPVVGDWDGDGDSDLGLFDAGTWQLKTLSPGTDLTCRFGTVGDLPIVGDWDGTGTSKVGVFRQGLWILDSNGNCLEDQEDRVIPAFGADGDQPLSGTWK